MFPYLHFIHLLAMIHRLWSTRDHILEKSQQRLSRVLSVTRQHTSGAVKFWKQIGQFARERLPLISTLNDLVRKEWFVSGIPIIHQGQGRRGRVILVMVDFALLIIILLYGKDMLSQAKINLTNLFLKFQLPQYIPLPIICLMIGVTISTLVYYLMIKPDDMKQVLKTHKEEREL